MPTLSVDMETVLSQLNAVPGVIGSMICDADGHVLGQAFPPLFDTALLTEAAGIVADAAAGLAVMSETGGILDFRYGDARVLLKPLPGATLLVLASKDTNLQFLNPSLSVAAVKLTKIKQTRASPASAAPLLTNTAPLPSNATPPPVEAADKNQQASKSVPTPTKGLEELHRRLAERKRRS